MLPFPDDDCTPSGSEKLKECLACGQPKPLAEYYIYPKTGKPFARCKPCHCEFTKAHSARRYAEDPEGHRAKRREYVAANRDEVNRRQTERRNEDIEAARQYCREWSAKPENRSKKAEYRRKNSERRRRYNSEYRRKHGAKVAAYNAEYAREHPEVYRDAARKWQAKNPLKIAAIRRTSRHKRRALMANVEGSFTEAEWQAIKERQDFTCPMCGYREPFIQLTVDHVIPISKGGSNYASNISALCSWCNSVKKDRIIDYRTYFKTRPKPRHKPFSRPRKRPASPA